MSIRQFSRRNFLKNTATLAAVGAVGIPELAWREAWATGATGGTTTNRTIVGSGGIYQKLSYGPGEPFLLRQDLGAPAQSGREQRRTSLLYFAHLSDTHIVDAQSPARVEYLDNLPLGDAAFRPQDMLTPYVLDSMVRRINTLRVSEISGSSLAFAINTGDTTDNKQYLELRWVIDTLDGGNVQLQSGGPTYQGVQKKNTWANYYHPDTPLLDSYGRLRNFPAYPGLLESAEMPMTAEGLRVPWYTVMGNHDGELQGVVPTLGFMQAVAVGSIKVMAFPGGVEQQNDFKKALLRGDSQPWKNLMDWAASHTDSPYVAVVTPDSRRRLLTHQQWISEHFTTNGMPMGHGFSHQNVESDKGYYSFDPVHGIHFVVLDTVSTGGGPNGNLDPTQYEWLNDDLTAHQSSITFVVAHHTIDTMDNVIPRLSDLRPPLLGAALEQLLLAHPNVVAFVNGHTHANTIIPHPNPNAPGTGFWEINTAAHNDWPQQARLIEVFDNGDGTLSIFGTMVDHMADPSSTSLSPLGMAAISRELAYNDPQWGRFVPTGTPMDRNVELIIARAGAATRLRRG